MWILDDAARAQKMAEQVVATLREERPGLRLRPLAVLGKPQDALVEEAAPYTPARSFAWRTSAPLLNSTAQGHRFRRGRRPGCAPNAGPLDPNIDGVISGI